MRDRTRQNIFVAALAQSVFLASMGTSMANLALPAIATEFGITFSDARLVVLSYLLATTIFSLLVGRFADTNGRRLTLYSGLALFIAATLAAAATSTFWILVLARIVQGIGAAALIVLPIVIASETASSNKTGRSIGLLATMSAVGTASGPSAGGFLLASFSWRSVFIAMSLLGALNLLLLLVGASQNEPVVKFNKSQKGLYQVLFSTFVDSYLRRQLLFNLVVSAVMMTTLIVGPFYLVKTLRLTPTEMGFALSAGPIASIVSGVFSGMAVDRFGTRAVVASGFVQLLLGTIAFVFLPVYFGALGFSISAILLSLGYQLFLAGNSTGIMQSSSTEQRGLVSGALSLSRNLGLILGASVLGSVFDPFGLQAAFGIGAVLITICFVSNYKNQLRSKSEAKIPVPVY